MVATRKAGDLISAGSTSGSATRRWTTTNAEPRATAATLSPSISGVSPVRASVTAADRARRGRARAGPRRRRRRRRGVHGRRLAQAVVAGGREDEREHRRDDVRRPPVLAAEQPGQHDPGRDADARGSRPRRRWPGPVRGRRVVASARIGQPAGEDGRAADALDDPGARRRGRAVGEHARDRTETEHDQAADAACGAGRCGRRAAPVASSVAARPMLIELITQARAPPPPCRSASVSATVAIGVT